MNFDMPQGGIEPFNDDSFMEQEYLNSFKMEEVELPEPTTENLVQISLIIQVGF